MVCLSKLVDSPSLTVLAQAGFAVTVQTMLSVMQSISCLDVLAYSHSGSVLTGIISFLPLPSPQCDRMMFQVHLRLLRDVEHVSPTRFPSGTSVTGG